MQGISFVFESFQFLWGILLGPACHAYLCLWLLIKPTEFAVDLSVKLLSSEGQILARSPYRDSRVANCARRHSICLNWRMLIRHRRHRRCCEGALKPRAKKLKSGQRGVEQREEDGGERGGSCLCSYPGHAITSANCRQSILLCALIQFRL